MASPSSGVTTTEKLKAFVVHPYLKSLPEGRKGGFAHREPDLALEEALRLAEAIDLDIVFSETVGLNEIRPATFIGKGVVDRLARNIAERKDITVVIINHDLSPVQQRNLERELKTKVLDRTALILEIFGERAQTRAGQLQVELASFQYQKSRLVRSWTHLERQRGGAGFMGGPGESQLEIDRRLIAERIDKLKKDLKKVRQTRQLNRQARQRNQFPVVALVGYTNAGKSTLFNKLTGSKVLAKDMLFATLDPTMRLVDLPDGTRIILADTVGFITDLPTNLIEAFKSTLEEVQEADLILHVRDIAHHETEEQRQDVIAVLRQLAIEVGAEEPPVIEVWNKIDLLEPATRTYYETLSRQQPFSAAISAEKGLNFDHLMKKISTLINRDVHTYDIWVPGSLGDAQAWLHENGHILGKTLEEADVHFQVQLKAVDFERFSRNYLKNHPQIRVETGNLSTF